MTVEERVLMCQTTDSEVARLLDTVNATPEAESRAGTFVQEVCGPAPVRHAQGDEKELVGDGA